MVGNLSNKGVLSKRSVKSIVGEKIVLNNTKRRSDFIFNFIPAISREETSSASPKIINPFRGHSKIELNILNKAAEIRNNVIKSVSNAVKRSSKNTQTAAAGVLMAAGVLTGNLPLVAVGGSVLLAGCQASPAKSTTPETRLTISSSDVENLRNIFVDPKAASLVIKPNTTKEDINKLNVSPETKAILLRVIDLSTYFNRPLSQFPISIGKPSVEILPPYAGYQITNSEVKTFLGAPPLFAIARENLQPEDRAAVQFAQILNSNIQATPTISVDSTASLLILNFVPEYKFRPGSETPQFPMIFTKFPTSENASPSPYLVGASAKNFFLTGLTMKVPNYLDPNCQVHAGINMDPISGAAPQSGGINVPDPRISTLRWFAWKGSVDQSGLPQSTWKINQDTDGDGVGDLLTGFNTFPLVSEAASPSVLENYFSGNVEVNEALGAIPDNISASPDIVVFNKTGRENPTRTNGVVAGKKVGLIYAFPQGNDGYRTEEIHFGLTINWPKQGVPYNPAANTSMTLYQYWPASMSVQSMSINLGTDRLSR